ncbi:hypothetical protein SteCoe_7942 [Stentor coeruleus]|uniref:Uncharacterized protein n=1 Tax=Stentor coeruleus TaxID=5963 RepID=A0A1R2CLL7_9CILI|nr:hypothetical protein SteCoe_7942 [Stentor coeruleus]
MNGIKLKFDDSFEILSKNRRRIHKRRTLSGVLELTSTGLHQKSFSSQLPKLPEDLHNFWIKNNRILQNQEFNHEIQKIKEEAEARCDKQKQREIMFDSILGPDCTLNTEDIQLQVNNKDKVKKTKESQESGMFSSCKNWFMRCFKIVK